jgi:hypothetical protein
MFKPHTNCFVSACTNTVLCQIIPPVVSLLQSCQRQKSLQSSHQEIVFRRLLSQTIPLNRLSLAIDTIVLQTLEVQSYQRHKKIAIDAIVSDTEKIAIDAIVSDGARDRVPSSLHAPLQSLMLPTYLLQQPFYMKESCVNYADGQVRLWYTRRKSLK